MKAGEIKNFIVLFGGKEGTSPLMRLLNNFENLTVIHQKDEEGWEPFDRHACGMMKHKDLKKCLELIYDNSNLDLELLNNIYCKTAKKPILYFNKDDSCGFKMRFKPLNNQFSEFFNFTPYLKRKYEDHNKKRYQNAMLKIFHKYNIVVYIVIRQDLFRWALSKYHGDGTGKVGHLQFKVANGKLKKEEIPKIEIKEDSFIKTIRQCNNLINAKKKLFYLLKKNNISVYPLLYEDFLNDKIYYFKNFFNYLKKDVTEKEINIAIDKGAYFKKIHSGDISKYVINHREISKKFGNIYAKWDL